MADYGVTCSMSRSGQLLGQTRDGELLLLAEDRTHRAQDLSHADDAKADVFDYIECFYNPKRRHSTIGYMSPMDFEMKARISLSACQ